MDDRPAFLLAQGAALLSRSATNLLLDPVERGDPPKRRSASFAIGAGPAAASS
jgi:hypothetical protein